MVVFQGNTHYFQSATLQISFEANVNRTALFESSGQNSKKYFKPSDVLIHVLHQRSDI